MHQIMNSVTTGGKKSVFKFNTCEVKILITFTCLYKYFAKSLVADISALLKSMKYSLLDLTYDY